jgi:hypothetical protein
VISERNFSSGGSRIPRAEDDHITTVGLRAGPDLRAEHDIMHGPGLVRKVTSCYRWIASAGSHHQSRKGYSFHSLCPVWKVFTVSSKDYGVPQGILSKNSFFTM